MATTISTWLRGKVTDIKERIGHDQHRNAFFLVLSNLIAAATGLVFWLLLARVFHLPASEIGIGYAIVGMGATIGVIAKGGLDTALLRSIPAATHDGAARLARFGILVGTAVALLLALALGAGATLLHAMPLVGTFGWLLVAAIAVFLVFTWLQDAYFLAEGNAKFGVQRNLVLSVARITLPLPVIALAMYQPVALTWLLALVASALVGFAVRGHVPVRTGREVPRSEFLRRSIRNTSSSAFEFLPGLILAPIVLMVDGATTAGHFAIVWAAASLLFVISAAICRSALSEMVQRGTTTISAAIRKGTWQHVLIVLPAAAIGVGFAHVILGVFGTQYATHGTATFAILCASTLFVAPSYLYLTVLRAADRTIPLIVFPALMLVALLVLTPILAKQFGLPGVGAAWLFANAPFGIFALWKLRTHIREVMSYQTTRPVASPTNLE